MITNDENLAESPQTEEFAQRDLINRQLGPSVSANCNVIDSDLNDAAKIAAQFEAQLAGKSEEIAHLKSVVEQVRSHFAHLQAGITELRQERHRLGNEAMRVMGLEMQLKKMTAERDRVKGELDVVLQALADAKDEKDERIHKRDIQIAALTVQIVNLKRDLEEARRLADPKNSTRSQHRAPKTAARDRLAFEGNDENPEILYT